MLSGRKVANSQKIHVKKNEFSKDPAEPRDLEYSSGGWTLETHLVALQTRPKQGSDTRKIPQNATEITHEKRDTKRWWILRYTWSIFEFFGLVGLLMDATSQRN